MAIEIKLCDCGCGRSRPMQSGGKYFEPACRARDHRRKRKSKPEDDCKSSTEVTEDAK
jgi:hypothetical protein